ncbi:putative tyrosyl-DNA phosphodiesterase [Danaus plexippus plexippus]|uniref:Tyrosyl-DNA phosphodiesterase n=1 Tax=Danaus plexippus plexippus TaxID=278856 RepID=A0A212FLB5_DANPL|nr:putative tyrosyl-DNA phosphodiesterase [Danaus plexippus plexippus]
MSLSNKRMNRDKVDQHNKRIKLACSYGESCYRMNPAHFREFSHPHLESILDNYSGSGDYDIPERFSLQRNMIREQLDMMIQNKLYEGQRRGDLARKDSEDSKKDGGEPKTDKAGTSRSSDGKKKAQTTDEEQMSSRTHEQTDTRSSKTCGDKKILDSTYRPMVPPTRDPRSFLDVVVSPGGMLSKHAAAAPYHVFYTTIKDSKKTHNQKYSITLLEILDSSLGELKCSLQINFMVDAGWLLAHYYFAGYSAKKLTILYGEESAELRNISAKKPNVEAHQVKMATPFGKHHTKMMLLCYEDGSLRVVVSTANLYMDDWENRTQGLWLSPSCPQLPAESPSHSGESPTGFKRSLLDYLHHYRLPQLAVYVHRVQRCDFSHINVFLVCSVPGTHYSASWGFLRVGALLRAHCAVPPQETRSWPLIAQASSLGSYGKDPGSWLTGDFLHHFTKIKDQPQTLTPPPDLKLIYPSLENVKSSHDGLLGGGCLPYSAAVHVKQPWLKDFLYQWRALHSERDRAMPHIKSYTRVSPDNSRAAFYLLTSGNVSKAAWGVRNKDGGLRLMSYEAGVLFLPRFVINSDFFPLCPSSALRLPVPYDLPPQRYSPDMSPWVSDYLY